MLRLMSHTSHLEGDIAVNITHRMPKSIAIHV